MAESIKPPFILSIVTIICISLLFLMGKLRDLFDFSRRRKGKKGYAPIREPSEDFYNRRLYMRIHDCWNRPICSAPDAWIDVMERHEVEDKTGVHDSTLQLAGTTRRCLNLGSYNYLGFAAADEYCTPRVLDTMHRLGVSSCSSRAEAGTTSAHVELEELVARFVGKEAAITYGMGFATNSASIPALLGKGCLVLSDALNHSSIVAGVRGSGAKVKVFRHNDAQHLEGLLRQSIAEGQPRTHRPWKKIMIIMEGIYSMEGEAGALAEIVAVKKRYGAYLYLDEAHSIGALGARGKGLCEQAGVDPADVDIMMGTFTKSFGSCGGYIAADKQVIDFLRRYSPAHVYASSMSPAAVQQVTSALQLLLGQDGTDRGRRKIRQLHDNANYVRQRMFEMGLDVLGDVNSPVMPVMMYSPIMIAAFSHACLARHVATVVVAFPATPLALARTRICISAAHSREDLEYALEVIADVTRSLNLQFKAPGPLSRLSRLITAK